MLFSLLIILSCLLAGDMISDFFALPIPGAVIGMGILLVGLIIKGGVSEEMDKTSDGLLRNIGLIFVPAGAGISLYIGLIVEEWLVILVASFTSTVLTLVFTALVFKLLQGKAND